MLPRYLYGQTKSSDQTVTKKTRVKIYANGDTHELISVNDAETGEKLEWEFELVVQPRAPSASSRALVDSTSTDTQTDRLQCLLPQYKGTNDEACAAVFASMTLKHPNIRAFQVAPWKEDACKVVPVPSVFRVPSSTIMSYENILIDTECFRFNVFAEVTCRKKEYELTPTFFDRKKPVAFASFMSDPSEGAGVGFLTTSADVEKLRPYAFTSNDMDPLLRRYRKEPSDRDLLDPFSSYTFGVFRTEASQLGPVRWSVYMSYQIPLVSREQVWFWFATLNLPLYDSRVSDMISRVESYGTRQVLNWCQHFSDLMEIDMHKPRIQVTGTVRVQESNAYAFTSGCCCTTDEGDNLFVYQPSRRRGGACVVDWKARNTRGSQMLSHLNTWPSQLPEGSDRKTHAKVIDQYKQLVTSTKPVIWDAVPHLFVQHKPCFTS